MRACLDTWTNCRLLEEASWHSATAVGHLKWHQIPIFHVQMAHKVSKQYIKSRERGRVEHRSLDSKTVPNWGDNHLRQKYFRAGSFCCRKLAHQSENITLMEILVWFFFLTFASRPCFAETYWQKAWTNGHCPGKPATAHSAASPSAEGERRSPKPPAAYTRYEK